MVKILDTDHFSMLLNNTPTVVERIQFFDVQDIAITIVTAEEQLRGRLNSIRQATPDEPDHRIVQAYWQLNSTLSQLSRYRILDFSQSAQEQFKSLQRQKIRIGTRDLRIAAIALSLRATIVTRNNRDFAKVPQLPLEDWTLLDNS